MANIANQTWITLADTLNTAKKGLRAGIHYDAIYVLGGIDATDSGNRQIEIILSNDTVIRVKGLCESVGYHSPIVIGNEMLVIGGLQPTHQTQEYHKIQYVSLLSLTMSGVGDGITTTDLAGNEESNSGIGSESGVWMVILVVVLSAVILCVVIFIILIKARIRINFNNQVNELNKADAAPIHDGKSSSVSVESAKNKEIPGLSVVHSSSAVNNRENRMNSDGANERIEPQGMELKEPGSHPAVDEIIIGGESDSENANQRKDTAGA